MITLKQIEEIITHDNAIDQKNEILFNELLPFITENNGKPAGKVFERKLKEKFPLASLEFRAGMTSIKFPTNENDGVCSFLVSYHGTIDLDVFKRNTWAIEAEHNRIKGNGAVSRETLQKFCDYLNAMEDIARFFENHYFPSFFSVVKLSQWEIKKRR